MKYTEENLMKHLNYIFNGDIRKQNIYLSILITDACARLFIYESKFNEKWFDKNILIKAYKQINKLGYLEFEE